MAQALYRKWRPHCWEDVVGQEHIVQTLRNAVAGQRLAHAYLFAGPRGTGKTTMARLLAKAMNCLDDNLAARPCDHCACCTAVNESRFLDLIEIDAASNTSVEDVRDLRDKINFLPNQGRFKVYIIDEVHMLSTAAFNALLKTLEEPPAHANFILATTEMHKIPATVLSRCQRYEFRRIPVKDIVAYLTRISQKERIQVEPAALDLVARQSAGGMRDAISLLDQLASTGNAITLEIVHAALGTATSTTVLELLDALLQHDAARGMELINGALDAGTDSRQLARQIVEYLRGLLMVRTRNADALDVTQEVREKMGQHAAALPVPELLRLTKTFNQAAVEGRSSWIPALVLEMAFLEGLEPIASGQDSQVPRSQPVTRQPPLPGRPIRNHQSVSQARELEQDVVSPDDVVHSELLEQNWPRIIELTRQQNPTTYGLINSCKARQLKDRVLTLGFATDVLKHKMENSATLDLLHSVLAQVFGHDIQVRVVTITGKRTTPPADVDADGMVASALRDLGGEIVDVQ